VLSTFVRYREVELARLMFHELAHQVVYVKDDSSFNESFAVVVEEEGLRRWLAAQAGRSDDASLVADADRSARLRAEFRALVRSARDELAALYASGAPEADQRAGKAAVFASMRAEYERMKAGWDGIPAFDRWFAAGANNAGIAAAGLYADRVPAFAALLAAEGGDLPRFYERVKELAARTKVERDLALANVPGNAATFPSPQPSPPLPGERG
jgi:predicted aminopeptidase